MGLGLGTFYLLFNVMPDTQPIIKCSFCNMKPHFPLGLHGSGRTAELTPGIFSSLTLLALLCFIFNFKLFWPFPSSCCLLMCLSSCIFLGWTIAAPKGVKVGGCGDGFQLSSMCTRVLGCCKCCIFDLVLSVPTLHYFHPGPVAGAWKGLGNFMINNNTGSYSCQEKVNCASCLGAPADHHRSQEGVLCLCSAFHNTLGCRIQAKTM